MITIVGYDGAPLSHEAREALAGAACVAGAERHLAELPVPPGARTIPLGPLGPALRELRGLDAPAVVVASGDPGFFGVLRALRAAGTRPRVIPGVSSVAMAFARLGLSWDDALVVTAHGRDRRAALAAALANPKAAILTDTREAGPGWFLPRLLAAGRGVYVAERLGAPGERVVPVRASDALDEFAHPNVVIAVDEERAHRHGPGWLAGHRGAPDGWGLPEDAFAHRDSMITKAEVRALALARLAPRPGTVVWDIGAGSGSVAVECARFGAYAVAFERDPAQCARIRENAAGFGVDVAVVEGAVPAGPGSEPGGDPGSVPGGEPGGGAGGGADGGAHGGAGIAPAPDAVFIGGGGPEVLDAVLAGDTPGAQARRVVAALAAVDRVGPVREVLDRRGFAPAGVALQASRLADLPEESIRLAAANPVFVLWGERP